MTDLQTPYHYARDHYGDGVWCVRGPGDFYLSVPEKNLAWCVAAMLNGHGAKAAKDARNLMEMLERDGIPEYLKEPAYVRDRRAQADRTVVADMSALCMKDRLHQRLERGWSPAEQTMEDVILEALMEPTEGMEKYYIFSCGIDPDAPSNTIKNPLSPLTGLLAYRAMITAAREGK